MKKRMTIIALVMTVVSLFAACSGGGDQRLKVSFGEAGWDSMQFHNAVAMFIGEAAYNIEPEEVSGTTAVTWNALKKGDIQVYMETWTDNISTYEEDKAEGSIKELSLNYDDNIQGLYVPRYVIEGDAERNIEPMAPDLKTVEDLKKYSNLFKDPDDPSKGRIYGAISGWEVDEVMRNKYKYYGLDEFYNYMDPGSDPALSAAISAAYEKGEPIVAYYWEPAWITGKYDIALLEDAPYDPAVYQEGKCACPAMDLTVCINSEFEKKAPEFCEFLSKYQTSSALTSEGLLYMHENEATTMEAAKWFLKEHDELVTQWLPEDKAKLVRDKLAA